jgi:branched-chain amino acid transport system substrate-binding protein
MPAALPAAWWRSSRLKFRRRVPATGDSLKEALLTIKEFDLPMTGKMIFDGHRVNKPVYLLTVDKGAFVPLATLT